MSFLALVTEKACHLCLARKLALKPPAMDLELSPRSQVWTPNPNSYHSAQTHTPWTVDIPLCIPRVTKGFLQLHLFWPSLSKTTTGLPLILEKTPSNFFNPYNLKSRPFFLLKQLNCSNIRVFKKTFIYILGGFESSPIEYWSVCWPRHPLAHCLVAGWTLV